MPVPNEWLLAISLCLNISVCWWVASYYFEEWTSRFFAGLACFSVQVALCCWIPSYAAALRPWTYFGTQALIAIGIVVAYSRRDGFRWAPDFAGIRAPSLGAYGWSAVLIVAAAWVAGCVFMARMPITSGDEVNYHAARAIYQIQDGSVLPRITAGYRQYHFPFQSELVFLYGVLFTAKESVGRVLFSLGFPVSILALVALGRRAGLVPLWTAIGALLFAFAPQVRFHVVALKPELWLAAYVAGFVYGLYASRTKPEQCGRYLALAGCFLALAINTKTTALLLLPVLVVAVFYGSLDRLRVRFIWSTAGFAAAALAIGLAYHFTWLTVQVGSPLGASDVNAFLRAKLSGQTVRVHTARTIMEMIEVPLIPVTRGGEERIAALGRSLGADENLQGESAGASWPGLYQFRNTLPGDRFGFAGLVVLFGFVPWTLWLAIDCARRRCRDIPPGVWIALSGTVLTLGIVYSMRWQYGGQVPRRFLIAAMPLLIAGGCLAWQRWFSRWPLAGAVVLALASVNAVGQFAIQLYVIDKIMQSATFSPEELHGRYTEPLKLMPHGSTILHFGSAESPDYLLFDSTDGYSRRIIPWGPYPRDPARLSRMIREHRVSHVFVEGFGPITYGGFPSQDQYSWLRDEMRRMNWAETRTDSGPVFTSPPRTATSP